MLPDHPPLNTDTSIKKGETGWAVYGLQSALNVVRGAGLAVDGAFGPATESSVKSYQRVEALTDDGIAGPITQRELVRRVCEAVVVEGIPAGLARGIVEGEGGSMFGAVNWSVAGGVDCGIVQERCTSPFIVGTTERTGTLMHAFRPGRSLTDALVTLRERARDYALQPWAAVSRERALRCAVMAHNWPAGARSIAKIGKCGSPDSTDGWWPETVKFPDGAPVRTRWDWCMFYSMGGPHGEGNITKYVSVW